MIVTSRLLLRPWQESDLLVLQSLRNNIELQALLLATACGSSLAAVRKWAEEKSCGPDCLFFVVGLLTTKEPVGYIQLSAEAGALGVFRFGICVMEQHQTHGYGSEAIAAIERYLELSLRTQKIILHVDEANVRAVKCYKTLQYRDVGVMRHHTIVRGRWRNVMIMEKLLSQATEAGD